jgi:hypothetical protein
VRIAYQLHKYELLPFATFDAVEAAMDQIGAVILCDKCGDGDAFQGNFDDHRLAVKSLDVVRDRAALLRSKNKRYRPWWVPRGLGGKITDEVAFAIKVANEVDELIVDLERGKGFFGIDKDNNPQFASPTKAWEAAIDMFQKLRAGAPHTRIILQPDPRELRRTPANGGILLSDLDGLIDGCYPQVYAAFFQKLGDKRPTEKIFADELKAVLQMENIIHGCTVYSDAGKADDTDPSDLRAQLNLLREQQIDPVYVFKAPVAPALAAVIRAAADVTPLDPLHEPAPVKEIIDRETQIWRKWFDGAQAAFQTGDPRDAQAANDVLAIMARNKQQHGVT